MNNFPLPSPLRVDGNLAENWRRFKQTFELYLTASGAKSKNDNVQASIFLSAIGNDALDIYNTFDFEDDSDRDKLNVLLRKFEEYFVPRVNIAYERHKFFTYNQQQNESLEQYINELKKRSRSCDFGELSPGILRDKLIAGVRDVGLKERLLRTADLTLETAISICRVAELTQAQMQDFQSSEAEIARIKKAPNNNKPFNQYYKKKAVGSFQKQKDYKSSDCSFCGRHHPPRHCPAYGKTCNKCGKNNHFANKCLSKMSLEKYRPKEQPSPSNPKYKVHDIETKDEYFLGNIQVDAVNCVNSKWLAHVTINGESVPLKLDTGADINVMSHSVFKRIRTTEVLTHADVKITGYSGTVIPCIGKTSFKCNTKRDCVEIEFYIVDKQGSTILGRVDCERLNFVSRICEMKSDYSALLEEFQDIFTGVGCLDKPYHIRVKEGAQPVISPPRRIPEGIKTRFKEELDRMIEQNIVEKFEGSAEWVHNPVIIEKPNGQLRICLDPRELNKAIVREPFVIPTLDELASRFKGAKYFSILDASNGFWQIKLTPESSNLCVFNTPFGLFKFVRLPFGLNAAPEIFQKTIEDVFKENTDVGNYFDDIYVLGSTKEEHDENLKEAFLTARRENLKLNLTKCKIGLEKVKYVGNIFSAQGVEADPDKIKAIVDMPSPTCKADLQRFLGMITYLARYIPNLSEKTEVLRELLKNSVDWLWTTSHEEAFMGLKHLVSTPPVLKYFDPSDDVTVSVDASKAGLGAVLMQKGIPVCFASRSLTDSERNYAQIEKEMLAIVFGMERFHYFVYGKNVFIETDHKPLESILKKPLAVAPPRLQRFMLRLQKYEFSVKYKPGKELVVADTLSRAWIEEPTEPDELLQIHEMERDIESQMKMHVDTLPMSNEKKELLRKATSEDPVLKSLMLMIKDGWPEDIKDVPDNLKTYWTFRDELSTCQNLIFKSHKLIIPLSMKSDILSKLHASHLGIEKTKERAKDCLFWIGMNKDIEVKIKNCEICAEYQHKNIKEPMVIQDVPSRPWEKVAVDLFEWRSKMYLILVDYYSNFVEIATLGQTQSRDIILHLKANFARYGIPDILISDNGPQFSSQEFSTFVHDWEIKHITSSPYYPKANGLAERMVQAIKNVLKKTEDPFIALLELRNTPTRNLNVSPAELLMGRKLKSKLPVTTELLKPRVVDHEEVYRKLVERQKQTAKTYNRGAHELPPLKIGDSILMERNGRWEPGIVKALADTPRSYFVQTRTGRYRRNRINLRPNCRPYFSNIDPFEEETSYMAESSRRNPSGNEDETSHRRSSRVRRKPLRFQD